MIVIDVKDANGEIVLRSRYRPEKHGTIAERCISLLKEVFEIEEATYDRNKNRWHTRKGEEAIWYEM